MDCFNFPQDKRPTAYQLEALENLIPKRKVSLRGPHGLGKTALASWVGLWAVLVFEDVKIPCTASSWRQLSKFLAPEIHKWAKRLRWDKIGHDPFKADELQTLSAKLSPTRELFMVASDNADLIEGAHADHLIYILDEAKAIKDDIWDAVEGAFSTGDCYALAISTPGNRVGRFYDIHRHAPGYEDWWSRHVTLEEAIAAGRVSSVWAEARLRQWGERSPVYQAKVIGNFPEQADNALLSLTWIEEARERELTPDLEVPPHAGVDVARFGRNDSVWMKGRGDIVLEAEIWHGNDTMEVAGKIKAKGVPATIDVIGVGSGVYDRLVEQGFECWAINVGESANEKDQYVNLRTEIFWRLRVRFQEGKIDLSRLTEEIYDRLSGELTSLGYDYKSDGRISLWSKEDLENLGGNSPDVADALAILFSDAGSRGKLAGTVGEPQKSRWGGGARDSGRWSGIMGSSNT